MEAGPGGLAQLDLVLPDLRAVGELDGRARMRSRAPSRARTRTVGVLPMRRGRSRARARRTRCAPGRGCSPRPGSRGGRRRPGPRRRRRRGTRVERGLRSSIALSCRRVSAVSDRVGFTCDDTPVDVGITEGESLLTVLRERLGVTSVKDGCAPQGQCGCCTVLVDGEPRVACVTPAARVQGRSVTTVGGLDAGVRDAPRRRLRGLRCVAVRVLHARHRRAGGGTAREATGRPGRARPCPRRPPLPVHGLADDLRRDRARRRPGRCRRGARSRCGGAARRARGWGGAAGRRRHRARWRWVRRRRSTPGRARRGAAPARIRRRRGRRRRLALGRRRLARRGAGPGREGAGAADDDRRAPAPPARRRTGGWRPPGDVVGRTRVPRAGRVVVHARR